jgi:hypothetical protein
VTHPCEEIREPLAHWALGLLAPEAVPPLAEEALVRGCAAPEVARLAGLREPLRRDIESELTALLRRLGRSRPTPEEAIKTVADAVALAIVEGRVEPAVGAHRLSNLANLAEFGDSPLWKQLSIHVGLASEWDDHEHRRSEYDVDIVDAARALLHAGGLQPEG